MKLQNSIKLALAGMAGGVCLSACATPPYVPTVYDASASNVQSNALAEDALPDKMGANELASAKRSGQAAAGLIGFLVVAAMEGAETASRADKLNDMMKTVGFNGEAEFEAIMTEKLSEAGYGDLPILPVDRRSRSALTQKNITDSEADAVLDVNMVTYGIQKAVTGEEWRPEPQVSKSNC